MKDFFYIIAILCLISCKGGNFSKGIKKDVNTGLTSNYNGLSVDDVYLSDAKGNKLENNKITIGNEIMIIANGVENYKLENGKAYPGCTILLTDKNKNEIINLQDAFSDLKDGLPPEQATELKAILTTGNPMMVGEKYQLYVHFYDKKNTASGISSTVEILIK